MADDGTRHDAHDPLLIAALLDRDASVTERAEADERRRSCPDCAALYADLLALAEAVRVQPAPARARDFALTAADAERLTPERAGEPGLPATRLTGVMTIRPGTADHAAHDTMLVASLVDHSLSGTDRAAAEAVVDACDRCAEIHADLAALVTATRRMPTPARPQEYTLSVGQAARLRSPWRRFLGVIGSPRDAISKPLAVGLTTLGIVGLLLTSIPSMSLGSASSAGGPAALPAASSAAGAPERVSGGGAEATGASDLSGEASTTNDAASTPPQAAMAASPAAPANQRPEPGGTPLPDGAGTVRGQAQPSPATVVAPIINGSGKAIGSAPADQQGTLDGANAAASGGPSLSLISAVLLVVGLVTFGIRRVARRTTDG